MIEEATKAEIGKTLDLVLHESGAQVLLAVEAGSRAWGFPSPDSDYDVRFIYVRPASWYLTIQPRRDVIEIPTVDPLDMNGWDLRKALFQVWRGNPNFYEWLFSPVVYRGEGGEFHKDMQKLAKRYFNPTTAIYHYLHTANGNYREYLRGEQVRLKKYLYVVRPLLCCLYVERYHSMPPVKFKDLSVATYQLVSEIVNREIDDLVLEKVKTPELGTGPRREVLNQWIEQQLTHFGTLARTTAKVSGAPDDLDEFFFNTVFRMRKYWT